MSPNTLTTPNSGPKLADFILIRRPPSRTNDSQPRLLLVWEVPPAGVRATTSNLRAVEISLVIPRRPTGWILDTDLGREVANASSAEDAAASFRGAIDSEFFKLRYSFVDSQAYFLAALLDQGSFFFLRPSAEAIRKVLLGDRCPNEHCENGLVAAAHRAEAYQRYNLPTLTMQGDRSHLPMVCPACIPKDVAIESEEQFLVALRLDSGVRVSNEELYAMRANQLHLDDRRLESGYEKIRVHPDVVWSVRRSAWVVRHEGRWLEEMQRLSPRSATETDHGQTADENPVGNNDQADQMPYESVYHSSTLPRKTFGQLQESIAQANCSICLAEGYENSDDVVILPCTHFFHEVCITAWLRQSRSCPECRHAVIGR